MRWILAALALAAVQAMAPAAQAKWLRAESPHFNLYGETSARELRRFVTGLERFDALLRTYTGVTKPVEAKLDVILVGDLSELRILMPGASALVGGFYSATPGRTIAVVRRDMGDFRKVALFHEYAHHFMYQFANLAYAPWYVEGFAEFFSTADITDERFILGGYEEGRVYALQTLSWLHFDRVLSGERKALTREEVHVYYAQSWLLTHWVFRDAARRKLFTDYLAGVAAGADPKTSFYTLFNTDAKQLEKALEQYLYRDMTKTLATWSPDATPVTISEMPKAADKLFLPYLRAQIARHSDDDAKLLAKVREEARAFPDDPFARNAAAAVELEFGERRTALTLLADDKCASGDAERIFLVGLAKLSAADDVSDTEVAAARQCFARVNALRPEQYTTLFRYVQTRDETALSDNDYRVLERAYALAPQVEMISFKLARVLIRRGDTDLAIKVLSPTANDPHADEARDYARKMIEEAKARGATAAAGK